MLLSSTVFVSVCSILMWGILGGSLQSRAIPKALYLGCQGGGLSQVCMNTIQQAWDSGVLRTITSEHQFFTGLGGNCKITFWT